MFVYTFVYSSRLQKKTRIQENVHFVSVGVLFGNGPVANVLLFNVIVINTMMFYRNLMTQQTCWLKTQSIHDSSLSRYTQMTPRIVMQTTIQWKNQMVDHVSNIEYRLLYFPNRSLCFTNRWLKIPNNFPFLPPSLKP